MADNHGHKSLPSIEIGQVWSYCRDNLRGTTPLAQWQIDCLTRDYVAPSKAHIRRVKRLRPLVLKRFPQSPKPDCPDKRSFNDAYAMGVESKRRNLRAAYGQTDLFAPPKPLPPIRHDYTRNATVPPDRDNWSHEHWVAESERLSREMEQAKREARQHG